MWVYSKGYPSGKEGALDCKKMCKHVLSYDVLEFIHYCINYNGKILTKCNNFIRHNSVKFFFNSFGHNRKTFLYLN